MASIHTLPRRIMVFTSLFELRQLADKMEARVKTIKLGEECTTEIWKGDDCEITLSFDQTKCTPDNPTGKR